MKVGDHRIDGTELVARQDKQVGLTVERFDRATAPAYERAWSRLELAFALKALGNRAAGLTADGKQKISQITTMHHKPMVRVKPN